MKYFLTSVAVCALLIASWQGPWHAAAVDAQGPWKAPEFPEREAADWINTRPLRLSELSGKVVLLDFWTYGCWNCTRSIPWLKRVEERYAGDEFVVVGVHTPEFEHEKDRAAVAAKVSELGIDHPVMIDNDAAYWKAMANRYWPTFYLVDKVGEVRGVYAGETRTGDRQSRQIEATIEKLLDESI